MARTVLLADDNATIQRVVELSFAGENVHVVSVGDGDAAIDAIRRSTPDVVLADIGMPGRSGYEVLAFVRSQPSLSGVPVLLLAGAFEPVDQAQAARLGADGVLTKPFDPASLVGRVSELFARPRGSAPSKMEAAAPASVSAPASRPATPAPAASPDRDRYFEEIDQAFAALSRAPRAPLTPRTPADDAVLDETGPDAPADAAARPSPAPTPLEPATVPLTDAFAALLDAERTGTPVDTLWRPAPAAAGDRVDVERLADLVARRVLEQLSDRVVRESVAAIVSATAERLVREEIERIKRHIK